MQHLESTGAGEICPASPFPRWRGERPAVFTRQRTAELRALRAWEVRGGKGESDPHKAAAMRQERARVKAGAMPGGMLLRLLGDGRAYPFALGTADTALRRLVIPVEGGARRVRDRDLRAVQLVAVAQLAARTPGLAATLATWSVLLGCSPKTAGDCVRELADAGFLELLPEYEPIYASPPPGRGDCSHDDCDCELLGHRRDCSTYRLGPVVLDALAEARKPSRHAGAPRLVAPPGESYQASDKNPPSSGSGTALPGLFGVGCADAIASGGPAGTAPAPASSSEASSPGAHPDPEAPEGVGLAPATHRLAGRNPAAVVARLTSDWQQLVAKNKAALAAQVQRRLAPIVGARRAHDLSRWDQGALWPEPSRPTSPATYPGPAAELAALLGDDTGPASTAVVVAAVTVARGHEPACACTVCGVLRRWRS